LKSKKTFQRIAAIDIGSNAIKFKQFRIRTSKNLYPLELDTFKRIDLRLGKDVFETNRISEKSEKRLIQELKNLSKQVKKRNVEWAGICATSATRNALNGSEVCSKIEEVCETSVKILSGRQEAYYLRDANTRKIENLKKPIYVDVGGGSTEIYMRNSSKELYESFDLGAVRIMKGKDSTKEWEKLKAFLGVVKENNADALVGIGGNIRRIFKILGLQKYSPLELKKFEEIRNNLSNMPIIDRINLYDLAEDRADVIVPASDIFSYILEHSNIKKLFAIDWGICDALAYEYLNNKLS
jgi:exopolyphosphatase/guanosine-5'-triphosphate,3'-diphosphate pyrophosphatase